PRGGLAPEDRAEGGSGDDHRRRGKDGAGRGLRGLRSVHAAFPVVGFLAGEAVGRVLRGLPLATEVLLDPRGAVGGEPAHRPGDASAGSREVWAGSPALPLDARRGVHGGCRTPGAVTGPADKGSARSAGSPGGRGGGGFLRLR